MTPDPRAHFAATGKMPVDEPRHRWLRRRDDRPTLGSSRAGRSARWVARSSRSTSCARSPPPRTRSARAPSTSTSSPTSTRPLAFKAAHPGALAMGEDGGRRPAGFDLSNSPVEAADADLDGRVLVQRTSAGTRGVIAARSADRLWCSSLVCASATAAAVRASGLGVPTYVITGRFADAPEWSGDDDLATARLIERARLAEDLDAVRTATVRRDVRGSSTHARARPGPRRPGRHRVRHACRRVRLRDGGHAPRRTPPTRRARSVITGSITVVRAGRWGRTARSASPKAPADRRPSTRRSPARRRCRPPCRPTCRSNRRRWRCRRGR